MSRSGSPEASISVHPAAQWRPGGADQRSDRELLRAASDGDSGASRALVDRHLRKLVAFAYRLLSDRAAAEDVAQETFLRLWKQGRDWQADAAIGGWLHRVAYNLCIDALRRRRPTDDIDDAVLPDRGDTPFQGHHRQEVSEMIAAALEALPDRQRAAIALVHYQEMSQIEAAEIMEVSVDALESLLARGRRALRDALSAHRNDLLGRTL